VDLPTHFNLEASKSHLRAEVAIDLMIRSLRRVISIIRSIRNTRITKRSTRNITHLVVKIAGQEIATMTSIVTPAEETITVKEAMEGTTDGMSNQEINLLIRRANMEQAEVHHHNLMKRLSAGTLGIITLVSHHRSQILICHLHSSSSKRVKRNSVVFQISQ
jgi:hypothetical protein